LGALFKRDRADPVDDFYLVFVDLHLFYQCANGVAALCPVGLLKAVVDAIREFLDAADHQLQVFLFGLLLGYRFPFAL
jgi:hypothetical protein